jgi:hypothetical protein
LAHRARAGLGYPSEPQNAVAVAVLHDRCGDPLSRALPLLHFAPAAFFVARRSEISGNFLREEIDKIRHGQHGARSPQQAIAIGLSKARRAGVALRPPKKGKATERTRRSTEYAYAVGQHRRKARRRPRVSRAVSQVLKREPRRAASHAALSRQARTAASYRSAASRAAAARRAAARLNGPAGRSAAARKAARTRRTRFRG